MVHGLDRGCPAIPGHPTSATESATGRPPGSAPAASSDQATRRGRTAGHRTWPFGGSPGRPMSSWSRRPGSCSASTSRPGGGRPGRTAPHPAAAEDHPEHRRRRLPGPPPWSARAARAQCRHRQSAGPGRRLDRDARPATGLETVIIVAVPARRTIGRRGASGFCTASTGGYPGSLAARTSTGSITGGRASSSDAWAISAAAT
jgi:hypothetical protein